MSPGDDRVEQRLLTDDDLLALVARITTAAVFTGLAHADAEDLAQDVVTWLVASGNLHSALIAPWLGAVIQNFIRRYLRRRWLEMRKRAATVHDSTLKSPGCADQTDAKLFLERLAARSPHRERRLIELMAAGHRLSEAARQIGIQHGSEQHHLGQIRARAKRLNRLPIVAT